MLLGLALAFAQSPPASVEEALVAAESYAVSDGSSIHTFHRDHRFVSGPVGMSGRTIEGFWERVDGGLRVTGTWGWVNGLSRPGDHRELVLSVTPHPGEPTKVGIAGVEVQPAYLVVERLVPVEASVFAERRAALAP